MKGLVTPTTLVATVEVVAPKATVGYVFPVAVIDYTFPVMAAFLDERGLHKVVKDVVLVGDFVSLTVGKQLTDLVGFTDAFLFQMGMTKQDNVTLVDAFTRVCDYKRTFTDPVLMLDAYKVSMGKSLKDSFTVGDALQLHVTKPFADTVGCVDHISMHTNKDVSDSFSVTDSLLIKGNGYCGLDYFAEDYMGIFQQA